MSPAEEIVDVARDFATEEQCLAYLEKMRWPDGVRCVDCGSDRISQFVAKEGARRFRNGKTGEIEIRKVPARRLYQCLECKRQFTALVRTVFNDTHLPLHKWFRAVALIVNRNGEVSTKQMERDLGVSYRTAWYVFHRVRRAMEEQEEGEPSAEATAEPPEVVAAVHKTRRPRRPSGKGSSSPGPTRRSLSSPAFEGES